MKTLTLDTIDKQFSPELLALMGEWFTFFQVGRENGLSWDKLPTVRDFFETGRISAHGAFSDKLIEYGSSTEKRSVYLEFFLKSYGIIGNCRDDIENYQYLKPIVSYDEVRNTFRENSSSGEAAIFPCFAWFSKSFLPETESIAFSYDFNCRPLLEAFCAEGYMARNGETFQWTPKIRTIMEILGHWRTEQELDAQAKEAEEMQRTMSVLDRLYEKAFEESFNTEDFTPLINFVKEYYPVISFRSSRALEEKGISSVIPIIGLIMLFGSLVPEQQLSLSDRHLDTLVEDLSETGEAMKILQRSDFWKVLELFEPNRINLDIKIDGPPKVYKLPWRGDPVE